MPLHTIVALDLEMEHKPMEDVLEHRPFQHSKYGKSRIIDYILESKIGKYPNQYESEIGAEGGKSDPEVLLEPEVLKSALHEPNLLRLFEELGDLSQ